VPRQAADTTTSVLRSVVDSPGATATVAQDSGWPSAAKTGTAEEDIAAWFAGYTPKLATVVAVLGMNPDNGKQEKLYHAMGLPRINGGGPPGDVWADYTAAALKGVPKTDFTLDVRSAPAAQPTTTTASPTDTGTTRPPATTAPPTTTVPPTTPPTTTVPPTTPPTTTVPPPTTEPGPTQTFDPIGGVTGGGPGGADGGGGGPDGTGPPGG
jgi:membrane peptidoglycan carboxypeptidase